MSDEIEPQRPIPRLPAEVLPCGCCVRVWCPHCARFNRHGRPMPGSDQTAHRVAHCWIDDSPYRQTGYELFEVGPVGTLDTPRRRIKPRMLRDGRAVSGFLAAQRAAQARA